MPNFQNNFATNLTSNVSATDTTSPLNSIPTVDAPYYLAFDATNVNAHYEVVYVTSDSATNVNHAALSYDHTTAEEVRMIVPAGHLNAHEGLAEGQMLNGKISPTVASNNLTVALKTKAGTDPSATDPVYVMIGGTLRTITAATSSTQVAGYNYLNMGSAELATKECDLFAYLVWDTNDAIVKLGFARIPYATLTGDFSATDTNEKGFLCNTDVETASTDVVVNIGRFAATLSAGAGYTWSVPTFTASNLIQRPIYETRWLDFVPTMKGSGGSIGTYAATVNGARYRVIGKNTFVNANAQITDKGSWTTDFQLILPFSALVDNVYPVMALVAAYNSNPLTAARGIGWLRTGNVMNIMNAAAATNLQWAGIAANDVLFANFNYEI